MSEESAIEKFTRIQKQIQNIVLKAYPNPRRKGCPGGRTVENLAKRAPDIRDDLEADPEYQHVMHCSLLPGIPRLHGRVAEAAHYRCGADAAADGKASQPHARPA
jgi:hypothetical protein